jgi:hypothetical protein
MTYKNKNKNKNKNIKKGGSNFSTTTLHIISIIVLIVSSIVLYLIIKKIDKTSENVKWWKNVANEIIDHEALAEPTKMIFTSYSPPDDIDRGINNILIATTRLIVESIENIKDTGKSLWNWLPPLGM